MMWPSLLVPSIVLCVCVLSQARSPKVDQKTFADSRPVHYIYPRTGRLFHADYVRDNEIFRSLERTNFMRRGPLARTVRMPRLEHLETGSTQNKHVYDNGKKELLKLGKGVPKKAILYKISESPGKESDKRYKRDVTETPKTTEKDLKQKKLDEKVETDHYNASVPENKVEEDSKPVVKDNDTDKTLLVYDFKSSEALRIPEVEAQSVDQMTRTEVDHGMRLYPVYRGVKYYYPEKERRLLYSPELSVHVDLPVVSDYLPLPKVNSTSEGRSRRRFKKLALPLLLALKLKTALLLPVILGFVSLLALKGLWSGLTALGIAAALGLKAIVGPPTKVVVQPPPPAPHIHHFPPHAEIAEYWNRRGEDYNDYRPNSWT